MSSNACLFDVFPKLLIPLRSTLPIFQFPILSSSFMSSSSEIETGVKIFMGLCKVQSNPPGVKTPSSISNAQLNDANIPALNKAYGSNS